MRGPVRWLWLGVALLALAGCGDPLNTAYGTTTGGSVNGLGVLKDYWGARFSPTVSMRLSPRLDEADLLLHVATERDFPASADEQQEDAEERPARQRARHGARKGVGGSRRLVGSEACGWIRDWLEAEEGRQFVLVLRDGNVAPWLCERWAGEAVVEAGAASPLVGEALRALAERLRERGRLAAEPPSLAPGEVATCPLFRLRGQAEAHPRLLDDGAAAPLAMLARAVPEAEGSTTLVAADGRPFAIAVPVGGSRLVVVANATPFLDAALVDPAARALLRRLSDQLAGWKPAAAAWVDRLAVRQGDPEPPNMLAMLFGKPPFSYVAFHLLALALAFLAWKSGWLGRVAPRGERSSERFSRHVEALAYHLRQANAFRAAAGAVARHQRRALAREPLNAVDARALVAELHRPGGEPSPSTPASVPSHVQEQP